MKASQTIKPDNNKHINDNIMVNDIQDINKYMKNKVNNDKKEFNPPLKQYLNKRYIDLELDERSCGSISIDMADNLVKELNDELKHASIINATTYKTKVKQTKKAKLTKKDREEYRTHLHHEDNKEQSPKSHFSRISRFSHLSRLSRNSRSTRCSKRSHCSLKKRHSHKRKHKSKHKRKHKLSRTSTKKRRARSLSKVDELKYKHSYV